MTGKTSIEWATAVWNPTTGCTRVSAGCDNCYAFALHDKRYKSNRDVAEAIDAGEGRRFRGGYAACHAREEGHKLPFPKQYDLPFSRVQLLEDRLGDPLRHKKPERYFVDSMADLFHEDVPDEFLDRIFLRMALNRRHTFLILTKRPERMAQYCKRVIPAPSTEELNAIVPFLTQPELDAVGDWARMTVAGLAEPPPNVWLGTSVEDQKAADERIPHLLATPAAVRFLSCEPLLGQVDLYDSAVAPLQHMPDEPNGLTGRIDWVIVGGESGRRARPMDLAWARSLVAQCRAAGVATFVKQLGADAVYACDDGSHPGEVHEWPLRESHGRDMAEWPEDLRVREFPR